MSKTFTEYLSKNKLIPIEDFNYLEEIIQANIDFLNQEFSEQNFNGKLVIEIIINKLLKEKLLLYQDGHIH